jgi:hypothetical protein
MNQSVVSIESLEEKISKALNLLGEVVVDIDTKTIVQTVSQPEPPKKVKKGGKKAGRPAGSKNKTAEAPQNTQWV